MQPIPPPTFRIRSALALLLTAHLLVHVASAFAERPASSAGERKPAPQPSRYRYTLEFDKKALPKGVTVREVKIGDGQIVRYMVKNTSDTPLIFNDKYDATERLVAGDKVVSGKAYQYFPTGVPMEGKQHLKGWQAPFGDMEEAGILMTTEPSRIAEGRKPGLGKDLPPSESSAIAVKYDGKAYELKVTIHYHLNAAYDGKP